MPVPALVRPLVPEMTPPTVSVLLPATVQVWPAPRTTGALTVPFSLALMALAVPVPALIRVRTLPAATVTGVGSLRVRLLRVMSAPSTMLLCWVAPVAEKTALAPLPGTRPVGVAPPASVVQLLTVPVESAMALSAPAALVPSSWFPFQ